MIIQSKHLSETKCELNRNGVTSLFETKLASRLNTQKHRRGAFYPLDCDRTYASCEGYTFIGNDGTEGVCGGLWLLGDQGSPSSRLSFVVDLRRKSRCE